MAGVWTETFTPNEAAALSELPERQVRKEIEHRIIEAANPPRLSFAALVYLRALKQMDLQLGVADRVRLARRLFEAVRSSPTTNVVEVGEVLVLRIGSVVKHLIEKVQQFERWKGKLVADHDIMGGEAVFPNSRLSVRRVGGMLERGEPADTILEDYPYLKSEDLDFARLYVRAYPRVGRPRSSQAPG